MTTFLWIMACGFIFGLVLAIISSLLKKSTLCMIALSVSFACSMMFIVDITVEPVKNIENVAKTHENTITYVEGVEFPEIYKLYKTNKLRADDMYKNNRYQITAKVNRMTNDGFLNFSKETTLTMEIKVDNTIVFLYATFEKDQDEFLKTINVGDTITFEGECLNYGSWANCKLIVN